MDTRSIWYQQTVLHFATPLHIQQGLLWSGPSWFSSSSYTLHCMFLEPTKYCPIYFWNFEILYTFIGPVLITFYMDRHIIWKKTNKSSFLKLVKEVKLGSNYTDEGSTVSSHKITCLKLRGNYKGKILLCLSNLIWNKKL